MRRGEQMERKRKKRRGRGRGGWVEVQQRREEGSIRKELKTGDCEKR